jgi:hypothetical protein
MNKAAYASLTSGRCKRSGAIDIDPMHRRGVRSRHADMSGEVKDLIAAAHRFFQALRIAKVAADRLETKPAQDRQMARWPVQHAQFGTALAQIAAEMITD